MAADVYKMVTDRIIAELEKGKIPWEKPWTGTRSGAYNRITKKPYSLLNQILLGRDGEWATFKQWTDLGGHVKKGEKSSFVTFWKMQTYTETQEDGTETEKIIPLLRYYNVFHISQVEGVEPLKDVELIENQPIEEAETILNNYWTREGITVEQEASNRAYYSPMRDLIHLPLLGQFQKVEDFYSTAFHESVHSTMKKSRCDREHENKLVAFGSAEYSFEELVAESGSAMIMNLLGLETPHSFRNTAAYIQSWIKVLRNEPKWIVSASSKAEKAAKYILGIE